MPQLYDQTILQHYEAQAQAHGLEPTSTMLDVTVRERETALVARVARLVLGQLRREGGADQHLTLCDVGCGNGYTLHLLSAQDPELHLAGFEFTPALLALARSRFAQTPRVTVSRGDVRALNAPDGRYDMVVCQRVLINLLEPADQRQGLAELARILRPGGFLLSLEAFEEPLAHLNAARAEFGLSPLPPAHHNRYLSSDFYRAEPSLVPVTGPLLEPDLPDDFLPSNFLSTHYFITRVLHPLALGPDRPFIRNSHFVRFLTSALPHPVGDYAPIKACVLRKQDGRPC